MIEKSPSRLENYADRAVALLTCNWIVKLFACSTAIVLLSQSFGADPDLFARVAVGRLIEHLGYLPFTDPFAFTEKNPIWIDHEWLSGVVFYLLSQAGGDPLIFGFKLGIACLTFSILLRAAQTWSPEATPAPIWSLLCIMHGIFAWMSTIRCQVFTYLFVAVLLIGYCELWRLGRKRYLLLSPAMMFVWCNLHGGFIVGLGLMGIGAGLSVLFYRKWAPITCSLLGLSLASTALNPYGFVEYWKYIVHAITMPRPAIEEWAPVSISDVNGLPMVVFLFFLAIGVVRLARQKSQRTFLVVSSVFLLVGFYFGFRHIRLIPFATSVAIVFGPAFFSECAKLFEELIPRYFLISRRVMGLFLVGAGSICWLRAVSILVTVPTSKLDFSSYPVNAIDWLKVNSSGGRLLVDFNNGSFALWRLFPQFTISMDGRYEEVYPESTNQLVAEAYKFGTAEGARALHRIDPDFILVPMYASRALNWKELGPEWHRVYSDNTFFILGRAGIKSKSAESIVGHPSSMWTPNF